MLAFDAVSASLNVLHTHEEQMASVGVEHIVHSRLLLLESFCMYSVGPQGWQMLLLLIAISCSEHTVQVTLPLLAATVFSVHMSHDCCPVRLAYLPSAQNRHVFCADTF